MPSWWLPVLWEIFTVSLNWDYTHEAPHLSAKSHALSQWLAKASTSFWFCLPYSSLPPHLPSQLPFLLSSLVPYFHGVPTSRSLLFSYQPSPSKTHDTTSVLWVNREQNLLSQVGGQTFIIWLYIANLLNSFFLVSPPTGLSPLWLLSSQCCFPKQELWGRVV